jgi:hypothetical protein
MTGFIAKLLCAWNPTTSSAWEKGRILFCNYARPLSAIRPDFSSHLVTHFQTVGFSEHRRTIDSDPDRERLGQDRPAVDTGLNPHAVFYRGRLLYFSLVTLTTTAYGDILPVHPVARSLATLESVTGQLFPATLLARLVALALQGRSPSE